VKAEPGRLKRQPRAQPTHIDRLLTVVDGCDGTRRIKKKKNKKANVLCQRIRREFDGQCK